MVLNEIGEEQITLWDIVKESSIDYLQMLYYPFSVNTIHIWQADTALGTL